MSLSVFDVADYFLVKSDEEAGDVITNLYLQKLVYYAQGFSLVFLNRPLFREPIEAWSLSPVVKVLFDKYKALGCNGAIPVPTDVNFRIYSEEEKVLLDNVYYAYGQYSPWRLKELALKEPTWKDAYGVRPGTEICLASMKRFFSTLVD